MWDQARRRGATPNRHGSDAGEPPEAAGDDELSLDQLSRTYARLIGDAGSPPAARGEPAPDAHAETDAPDDCLLTEDERPCELSPRSILEAMLFVGHPDNQPLTAKQAASLMRGVRPSEIDDLVRELNEIYAAEGCPYWVVSVGAGYCLRLRDEFAPLQRSFYGRVREVRLSQAAIDVLAIVAYSQPVTREQVDKLRGKPAGAILRQLVRRQLLRIERRHDKPGAPQYFTTDRFLDLFGLASLSDLPRSQELDRS
jgi:segregation and condensation protein B